MKRALETRGAPTDAEIDSEQTAGFERALGSLWMAFQPIVSASLGRPIAYEALVRSASRGSSDRVRSSITPRRRID